MLEDVVRGEMAEKELDAFIERRAKQNDKANAEAAAERMASASRNRRYRQAVLHQRLQFHEEQIHRHTATFERLIRRHRVGLRLCQEALGLLITNDEGENAA